MNGLVNAKQDCSSYKPVKCLRTHTEMHFISRVEFGQRLEELEPTPKMPKIAGIC